MPSPHFPIGGSCCSLARFVCEIVCKAVQVFLFLKCTENSVHLGSSLRILGCIKDELGGENVEETQLQSFYWWVGGAQ